MKKAEFRDVGAGDIGDVKRLIYLTWEWPKMIKGQSTIDATLGVYVNQVLNASTFARVAVVDGEVVGVIFCGAAGESPVYRMLQDSGAEHALALLNAPEDDRVDICHALSMLTKAYDTHLEGREYDGTITFLAICPEAQGMNLGRQLWNLAEEYFKTHNTKSIYLFTDTSCNYGFYEHLGFSRRHEQDLKFHLNGENLDITSYLYDYQC